MSTYIIELKDHGVRVCNDQGLLVQSPGFANIAAEKPVFGKQARELYRLHPRQSFNQFWSQLSLDKLVNTNDYFRHQADLAYGHLSTLGLDAGIQGNVIFAIPSNFSRNQLAILLGLTKQCDFTATGLVDLSVAAAAGATSAASILVVDIQLHQTVLVRLKNSGGKITRETVQQIPGTGLVQLQDAWCNMITDAFIKQSRFNPLHNAETEQYIYNQLEGWIDAARAGNEVLMEINHKGTVHQAKLNMGYFEQKAGAILGRVRQELDGLTNDIDEILVFSDMASLPGVSVYLPEMTLIEDTHVASQCLNHEQHISGNPDALGFVTALPAKDRPQSTNASAAVNGASHVLINHRAYRLPDNTLCIGPRGGKGPSGKGVVFIEVDDAGLNEPITFTRQDGHFVLDKKGNDAIKVNGESPVQPHPLALGDRIDIVNSGINIQFIQVE